MKNLFNQAFFALLALAVVFSCSQKEDEIMVSSISLSQPTAEMIIGESITITATVLPSNATDKAVTWASSKVSVATVSDGRVTAVSEGSATITASAGGKSATCVITVSKGMVEVTSITLNRDELSLVEDESSILTATVKPDDATDKTVTWASSDKAVATVEDGKVAAHSEGEATITATCGKFSATCKVIVSSKYVSVISVSLDKDNLPLIKGQSETLVATVEPDNATDKTVTWTSSDNEVASVEEGTVTALKAGTATITAIAGSQSATCAVTVTVPVASVTLEPASITLREGEETIIVATVSPEDATDKSVIWSSSDESIATVSSEGKVSAIKEGSAVITTRAGERSATCAVTVLHDQKTDAIVFADNMVKQRLVARFDKNDDGEISYYEAEAVESIDGVFPQNILSFDEFQYFTGVRVIGEQTFAYSWMTSIVLPESLREIGNGAFLSSSLTSVVIPDGVTSIGSSAFSQCHYLTSAKLPQSLDKIRDGMFYGCESLISINIPTTVSQIQQWSFYGCMGLISVSIPENTTTIGNAAFMDCTSLTSVTIYAKQVPYTYAEWNSSVFSNTNDCPIYVPASLINKYMTADVWSMYAARFKAIPGTGESDPLLPDNVATEFSNQFGLGWNLGNQLDAYNMSTGIPNENFWGNPGATQATFNGVKSAGFASVRIPISWMGYIGAAPDYQIDETWMSRIGEVVEAAHTAGLNVIINTHHDENHGENDSSHWLDIKNAAKNAEVNTTIKEKITAVWTQIANKFKDCGEWLMMEGFNEINDGGWGYSADFISDPTKQCNILNDWNQCFVNAVRATGGNNATRWLGVPTYAASATYTQYLRLPNDPAGKTAVAIHYYDPYDYTIGERQYSDWGHTGATWKKASSGDEDYVKSVFGSLLSTYISNGIPCYLGEFGCSMRAKNNSRAWSFYKYYLEYIVKAAKVYGLPCFLWDNGNNGYGMEYHGYIDHGSGEYINGSKELIDVMAKARYTEYDGYTLYSVYCSAPDYWN